MAEIEPVGLSLMGSCLLQDMQAIGMHVLENRGGQNQNPSSLWLLNLRDLPMAQFYIATGLENVSAHHLVRDALVARGHILTYDWTLHGRLTSLEGLQEAAHAMQLAVWSADCVVVLLPGKKGTHTEFGMALAAGKPIVLHSDHPDLFQPTADTCAFYHLSQVHHDVGPLPERLEQLVDLVIQQGLQHPSRATRILYTNWRGETAWRLIEPRALSFGATEWHPEPQWLLTALDLERSVVRQFACKDIAEWQPQASPASAGVGRE